MLRDHTRAGEEAQVDFGSAGTLLDPRTGQPRPAWVFVMTLGYSRHQYADSAFDQTVTTWIACNRQAFGGVPRRIVPDNLKAAALEGNLYDPLLGEAYGRCSQHDGFVISPTRPPTPEKKGKVENGVHFVKRCFLAGQRFTDPPSANARLRAWIREQAAAREHGTTCRATTHGPPYAQHAEFRLAEPWMSKEPLTSTPSLRLGGTLAAR